MRAVQVPALLRRTNRLLARRYGTPNLGNKRHPVSELIFIILSARTHAANHEAAYGALRRRYLSWQALKRARVDSVERTIRNAGLSRLKARQIKGLLDRLWKDFGSLEGRALRGMSDHDLEVYLSSLPGVGVKTARCVMMYALDRQVFPVDTHCMRLFVHLGLLKTRLRFDRAQDVLQPLVPVDIRRSLHINVVAHGRQTCIPGAERCHCCVIAAHCLKGPPH